MGEVYRARDRRLGREVAVKVLPAGAASDSQRLKRFETEARAVAALSHPNVLAVYDVGSQAEVPYVVFELLAGETLRERLAGGPMPVRKAVELGIQMCQGLAAAHARAVLHRDLKPENLFLTRGDLLKILDFGLAKLEIGREAREAGASGDKTETQPGLLLGTVGYLAPEQVRGRPADARSDVFAAGVVLFEMISGRRPFRAETSPETLAAILRLDTPGLSSPYGSVPPGLERIVRRCLEKDPEDRFQSARDVAFALEALSGVSSGETVTSAVTRPGSRRSVSPGPAVALVAALALVAIVAATWAAARRFTPLRLPRITQLTFRRGLVEPARFAPDGRTLVFSTLWDGRPSEVFKMRLEDFEPEPVGVAGARLLAVSSQAELAVLLGRADEVGWIRRGTLARVPLSGGEPRRLVEQVVAADWSPDGHELAILRQDGILYDPAARLEYPIGTVLVKQIRGREIRVHPKGDRVAVRTPDAVVIADRSGRQVRLEAPPAANGLAWDPRGDALWVSANAGTRPGDRTPFGDVVQARQGMWVPRGIWRLHLDGRREEVYRTAGGLTLDDLATDGRILAHLGTVTSGVRVKAPGQDREVELRTRGLPTVRDITTDGSLLLTTEVLPRSVQVWLRPTAGGPGTRVADVPAAATFVAMTPDARWVAAWQPREGPRQAAGSGPIDTSPAAVADTEFNLTLMPTGSGASRVIPTERFGKGGGIDWFHFDNEDTLVALAAEPGRRWRGWTWTLSGGVWRPITPEGVSPLWIRWAENEVIGVDWQDPDYLTHRCFTRYPLDGGPPRPFPVSVPPEFGELVGPSPGGRFGYMMLKPFGSVPSVVKLIDLTTGEMRPWHTFEPEDITGVTWIEPLQVFRQGTAGYAYGYTRHLQDLYLFEGLR